MSHYSTVKTAIEHIVERKLEAVSLSEIAQSLGVSGGYLQKIFTEWAGISPKQFSRYLSLEYSKNILRESKNTVHAAIRSGLSGGGRLHDLFVDIEAMTPGEYQNHGENLTIFYSVFDTKFGSCLVASTKRGICTILFCDTAEEGIAELRQRWKKSALVQRVESSHRSIQRYFSGLSPKSKIKLHLRGTNFQIKVWEALLSIPEGNILSYGDVAELVGERRLSRAVGNVIGDNPVGYIIPCHRVLKSTGEISGYRWGVNRKRTMLCYEAIRKNR